MAAGEQSAPPPKAQGGAPNGPRDPFGRATHLVFGSAAVVLGALGRGLIRLGTREDAPGGGTPAGPEPARTVANHPPAPTEPSGAPTSASAVPAHPDDAAAATASGAAAAATESGAATTASGVSSTAVLTLAIVGLGAEVTRRVVGIGAAAAGMAEQSAAALMQHQPVPDAIDRLRGDVTAWSERGRDALRSGESAALDFGYDLAAQVVPHVVSRVDLNAFVDQVDIGRIVDRLDLNEIASRLDLNEIAARIDIERIVRRLDLAAITQGVLDQLDLTAISQRVLDQLDLTAVAMRVIDELELGELIRESSSTVTVEAVDALRVGGMNADRFVGQLMNRILLRRNGEANASGEAEASNSPPGDPTP